MANFYSVLSFLAVDSFVPSEPGSFDMLSNLPVEMAITILRLLPGKDLLNAVLVNKEWLRLCRSDSRLRQRVRRHLRHMRRVRLLGSYGRNVNLPGERTAMTNTVNKCQHSLARRVIGDQAVESRPMPIPDLRDQFARPKRKAVTQSKIETKTCKKLRI